MAQPQARKWRDRKAQPDPEPVVRAPQPEPPQVSPQGRAALQRTLDVVRRKGPPRLDEASGPAAQLNIRIPRPLMAEIDSYADQRSLSRVEVVRLALAQFLGVVA